MGSTAKPAAINTVVVHPLVLLSVVDHYKRVAKDTKKRVVGVLLGETNKGVVDITNSYAGAHAQIYRSMAWGGGRREGSKDSSSPFR